MKALKITVIAIITVVLLIIILQNTEEVQTDVLFVDIIMPRALLLACALFAGYLLGLATPTMLKARRKMTK